MMMRRGGKEKKMRREGRRGEGKGDGRKQEPCGSVASALKLF